MYELWNAIVETALSAGRLNFILPIEYHRRPSLYILKFTFSK